MKGIQLHQLYKNSDESDMYYCLVKNPEKKTIVALVMMVCVRVVGLVCHPPAAVNHGRLIALAHSARSFTPTLVDTQFQ